MAFYSEITKGFMYADIKTAELLMRNQQREILLPSWTKPGCLIKKINPIYTYSVMGDRKEAIWYENDDMRYTHSRYVIVRITFKEKGECGNCKKTCDYVCDRCKRFYCSTICQIDHRTIHEKTCRPSSSRPVEEMVIKQYFEFFDEEKLDDARYNIVLEPTYFSGWMLESDIDPFDTIWNTKIHKTFGGFTKRSIKTLMLIWTQNKSITSKLQKTSISELPREILYIVFSMIVY
jgi:hypothetical protein